MTDRKGLRVVKSGRPAVKKKAGGAGTKSRIVIVPMPDGGLYAFDKESMLQVRVLSAVEVLLEDGAEWSFADYREPA